jgi:lauroyl/myristoyl acyltransferase
MTNRTLLLMLFKALAGLTPYDVLSALRDFLEWRIEDAQRIHDTDQVQRFRNLRACLPEWGE